MPLFAKKLLKIVFFLFLFIIPGQNVSAGLSERRNEVVLAVEKAGPAVVNIRAEQKIEEYEKFSFGDPFFDEFFKDFFEPRYKKEYVETNLGSGLIISKHGYIITNQHVIRSTSDIKVILADKREFHARIIGADPETDIAVLKIKPDKELPYLTLGSSDDLMIGETVIAIGNPYGLSHTVTKGVVSAIGRTVKTNDRTYTNFIQTDASINPGNSGGPLLNIDGEVIGINTAIYEKAQGIGFAIPIDVVKRIVEDLISYGEVHKGWVGVQVQDLTAKLASYFNFPGTKAILISKVYEKSPAEKAGLKAGDIIISINKTNTESKQIYNEILRQYTTGTTLNLVIYRKDEHKDIKLVTEDFPDRYFKDYLEDILGVTLADINNDNINEFNLRTDEGILILDVKKDEMAYKSGIQNGDVIRKVDDYIVKNKDELYKALKSLKSKKASILLLIQRGKYGYYVTMKLS
jgi:Do/DeqQ family serine protease